LPKKKFVKKRKKGTPRWRKIEAISTLTIITEHAALFLKI
jgi:hypothetical protein